MESWSALPVRPVGIGTTQESEHNSKPITTQRSPWPRRPCELPCLRSTTPSFQPILHQMRQGCGRPILGSRPDDQGPTGQGRHEPAGALCHGRPADSGWAVPALGKPAGASAGVPRFSLHPEWGSGDRRGCQSSAPDDRAGHDRRRRALWFVAAAEEAAAMTEPFIRTPFSPAPRSGTWLSRLPS